MEAVIVFNSGSPYRLAFQAILAFVAIVSIAMVQSGCTPGPASVNGNNPMSGNRSSDLRNVNVTPDNAPNLAIGTFNIQMLGKTKMSKPGVVKVLVDIAQRFDILAIQELRDKDQNVIPELMNQINLGGYRYAAAIGPRQGYVVEGKRTTYFEQTVFIYDTQTVAMMGDAYVAQDPTNDMHRPPLVGHFRSIQVPDEEAFTFVLMNVHVDPDDAHVEFESLQKVIDGVFVNHPIQGEDDFILLGDLNDEPHRYQHYRWMNDQITATPSQLKTNTVQTRAYDNIVFDASRTSEFLQQAGVLDLMSEYQLTLTEAKAVSDHMPVWAIFSAYESPSAEITQGQQTVVR